MKLTGQLGSASTNKVLTLLEFTKQKVEFVDLKNPKDKSVAAQTPLGKFPFLTTPEGPITQTNAIHRYLAQGHALEGGSPYEQAKVRQWVDFSAQLLEPVLLQLVAPVFGKYPYDSKKNDLALRDLRNLLQILNEDLKKTTFLAGSAFTLADISVACALIHAYQFCLDEQFRKSFLAVFAWLEKVVAK